MDEKGNEVLTYLEGEVLADPAWQPGQPTPWPSWAQSNDALAATGRLLRELHAAAGTFRPSDPVWKQYDWPVLVDEEIVCHGDIGPHNTVYQDGLPVAFIDWDSVRPDLPLIEFGNAAWRFVPFGDERYFAASGFRKVPSLADRLALFATAYGVTDRGQVLWALQHSMQRSVETFRQWPLNAAGAALALRFVAGQLEWLAANSDGLVAGLD